ncbi:MAG: hypothetical protein Q9179_001190 [Wetmoreana sp. 5 TL-2023]
MATTKSQTLRFDGKSLTLPSEILIQIAEYVACLPSSQKDLWAMTRVSRSWYAAAVPALYHSPNITGRNFQLFVRTLCPSINPHLRKTDFSAMIKVLDMSKLVHDGSKSLTSRILGRVRDGLEVFVAPQSSFAINCLAALSKCQHLRELDLSLISQNVGLTQLLRSTSKLIQLQLMSIKCNGGALPKPSDPDPSWPPSLSRLSISGTLDDKDLLLLRSLPSSVISLTFSYCPRLSTGPVKGLVKTLGCSLLHLHLGRQANNIRCERLSDWLCDLPKLRLFRVTLRNQQSLGTIMINYQTIFGGQNPHPLEYLMFDCTDVNGYWTDADYEELWSAVAEGYLGRLRRVEFHYRKNARPPKFVKKQLEELNDLLQALAREDREREIINVEDAGAYIGKG